MTRAIQLLLDILDLEEIAHNRFRGRSLQAGWQRVFGGQVVGQALVAAARTVKDRPVHSLHAYFMLPGDPAVPIDYHVDSIRTGGSFSTRNVVAFQHDQAIFSMSASFQNVEKGLDHQTEMPDVPMPDDLPSVSELREHYLQNAPEPIRRYWMVDRPIELRPVDISRYTSSPRLQPRQDLWIRANGTLPDNPDIHRCVLAYATDITLLDTTLLAHGLSIFDPQIQGASLDHAVWFHRDFRADEWLLFSQDSPSASGARGFSRGSLFTRDGTLIASVAQEGLIRQRRR